jgi:hypothetical protein
MTNEPRRIYLFRCACIARGSHTVICAAPVDLVMAAYGGGGCHDQEGVQRAFGGSLFYRNDGTGDRVIGVWGARNASRFRTALRRKAFIEIVRAPPPARLAWWTTADRRPPAVEQRGID